MLQNERKFAMSAEDDEDAEPTHEELGEIMINTGNVQLADL